MCPPNNRVPNNYEQTKKVVKDLDNDVIYIDCHCKGRILFCSGRHKHGCMQVLLAFKMEEAKVTTKKSESIAILEDALLAVKTSTAEAVCIKK